MRVEVQRKFLGIVPVSFRRELEPGACLDLHRKRHRPYLNTSDKCLVVVNGGVAVLSFEITAQPDSKLPAARLIREENYRNPTEINSAHLQTPLNLALTRLVISCR